MASPYGLVQKDRVDADESVKAEWLVSLKQPKGRIGAQEKPGRSIWRLTQYVTRNTKPIRVIVQTSFSFSISCLDLGVIWCDAGRRLFMYVYPKKERTQATNVYIVQAKESSRNL